ncbi:MAG: hypothetical protein QM256_00420 [Pseudomonadota bacterium]|jgi:hypothetical protein|nr:hypothetical protein [Syntrophaceae bacterium]MDI9554231.1 hypothetical protein [Pseudomonadota bacterium]NLX31710.1 hypothetical protein [Deltaproteobacteria bacterium]HNZ34283.1 hypothetical protein [Syntrophales bacterium]HOH44443.1 hypothetical protein [Syntrophales bacterium]
MTDKQWDELIESFEVVKYGDDKDDPQQTPGKDIRCGQAVPFNRSQHR